MGHYQIVGSHVIPYQTDATVIVDSAKHCPQAIQFGQDADQVALLVYHADPRYLVVDDDLHGIQHVVLAAHLDGIGQHVVPQIDGLQHNYLL